ncbi:hypothetical protein FRB99_008577 [Tulasnella sp. 403]|nr:hypothetical protein FRB99_008577 [Tulasnella sp. 403]
MSIRKSERTLAKRLADGESSDKIVTTISPAKRAKVEPKDHPTSLSYLLTHPRSKLAKLDIQTVFNEDTWALLPVETRNRLAQFLPATSFQTFQPQVDPAHPLNNGASSEPGPSVDKIAVDTGLDASELLVPRFLSCHYLQAAARQWQDQILGGYFTQKHLTRVEAYNGAVSSGAAHAPWKDEECSRKVVTKQLLVRPSLPLPKPYSITHNPLTPSPLQKLQSVSTTSHTLTFFLPQSDTPTFSEDILSFPAESLPDIPTKLLTPTLTDTKTPKRTKYTLSDFDDFDSPIHSEPEYVSITARTTAAALESHILPLYPSIPVKQRSQASEANSAKCFTVWRRNTPETDFCDLLAGEFGGREQIGSLYYLMETCPS